MSKKEKVETKKEISYLDKLLTRFELLGWYNHYHDLVIIKLQGGFERFSGKASETWECRYEVTIADLPELNIKSHTTIGVTLESACHSMCEYLEGLDGSVA